jgi:hypothetical protein
MPATPAALLTLALAALLGAHPQQDTASAAAIRATAITTPVRLDGRLDEPFWASADSITDLRQREPLEGTPASERTVVRVARDADALYVGVRLYDADPSQLRATQLRRDADLSDNDDVVTLLIDGLRDRRSGFLFGTNPNGAMWDAEITLQDDADENWNGVWQVAASRDSAGWTAEFRIPFRTLRFHAESAATFGFNVRRSIRRKNEEDLWQGWGRTQGLYRQQYEGRIVGLGPLSRARELELRPYALGSAVADDRDPSGAVTGTGRLDGKLGLDAKLGVTSTVTADLTVNTDFAQVEADQQVINLTRFPLFFPEKRAFFLESSGIFSFGFNEISQLFYSRRIGLSQDSAGNTAAVPITAGGRVYGKAGPWTLGLLDARTGGADQSNDVVVRIKHDLFDRSYLGAMATLRSGPGAHGVERAFGLDADFPLVVKGRNIEPTFWIAGTRVPDVAGTPVAFRLAADYPNDLFDNFVALYRIERGFSPTLGFFRRTGIWETTGHMHFRPRPKALGLRRLDIKFPIPEWDIIVPEGGSLGRVGDWQTARFEWRPLGGEFESGDQFEVNFQRELDAPPDTFEVFGDVSVPAGRYWWSRWELQYETSQARALSAGLHLSWGGFYGGKSTEIELETSWHPGGHLIAGLDITRTEARLAGGHFTAVEGAARLEYAFDTRTALLGFVQWNNEDQRVDFNIRFHWIPVIGDDVYVVWNSGYTTDPMAPYRFPRWRGWTRPLNGALVVKAVHRIAG